MKIGRHSNEFVTFTVLDVIKKLPHCGASLIGGHFFAASSRLNIIPWETFFEIHSVRN